MRYIIDGKIIDVRGDQKFRNVWEEDVTTIYRGVTKEISIGFKDEDSLDPIDITGAEVNASLGGIEFEIGDGVELDGDGMLGKVIVTIPDTASSGISVGRTVLIGEVLRSGEDPITFSHNVEISDLPV